MYERIHIDNYKCLVDFDLHLSETSLLVGSNGSGKTAVLDVVFGLRRLLAGEAKVNDRIAFHPSTLTRWQPGREQLFEMDVSACGERYRYRLKVEHTLDERQSRVVEESLVSHGDTLFRCDLGEVRLYRDDGSEGPAYRADWSESALARVAPQPANTRSVEPCCSLTSPTTLWRWPSYSPGSSPWSNCVRKHPHKPSCARTIQN